jgi:ubiquitin-protein ligase
MLTLYQHRLEQEWKLLQLLAESNPTTLQDLVRSKERSGDIFRFTLHHTQGLIVIREPGHFRLLNSHQVSLLFPRFFPSVAIEASLGDPLFHPNIHPENGFVCLWNRFSPGDTVINAVGQLQQVITWKLINEEADHIMQPGAVAWYKDPLRRTELPLACRSITKPANFERERTFAVRPDSYRRRLE